MNRRYSVNASEVRLYAYCPRLYFFETHMGARRSLLSLIKITRGKLLHLFKSFIARLRGYKAEELLKVDLGKIMIKGKPDNYMIKGDMGIVVEFKSGRGPRKGAWFSDIMQATVYSFILARMGYGRVYSLILYRDSTYSFKVDEFHLSNLLRVIDDTIMVKYHGIVPHPLRSYRKCTVCPYKVECFLLDRGLEVSVEEPGSWLKEIL